jgi:nicotinamide-nucleotide amidase
MSFDDLVRDAELLLNACRAAGVRLAAAESCTGGLIAASLTAIAGSSDVVERGFVTYSNEAKSEQLGVPMELIMRHGAVSDAVAIAMAEGALARSHADIAVSVTGIAGPGGATAAKPVGLVHLGCVRRGRPVLHEQRVFAGDRAFVREQSVALAFAMIRRQLVVSA